MGKKALVLECCQELRKQVRATNAGDWHKDHVNGLAALIKEHEGKVGSIEEFRTKLQVLAKNQTARKTRNRLEIIYEGLVVHKVKPTEAAVLARNSIKLNEYKTALRSIYAEELLRHLEAYSERINSIQSAFRKAA